MGVIYLNGKGDVSIRTEPPSLVARTMVEPSTCHEREEEEGKEEEEG